MEKNYEIADELSRIAGQFKRFNDLKEVEMVLTYDKKFFKTMDEVKKQKQTRYDEIRERGNH
jgi:hypothetical protein